MIAEFLAGTVAFLTVLVVLGAIADKWEQRGQALVEFALIAPILLFMVLAVVELGSFGARWIRWQSLASQMAVGAVGGVLPAWWTDEASGAACGAPEAVLTPGDPLRVTLTCTYAGMAINGLTWSVQVEGIAAVPPSPSPSPSPSPTVTLSPSPEASS